MKTKLKARVWLSLAVLVYISTEVYIFRTKNYEAAILEVVIMTIMTFPSGILVPVCWTMLLGATEHVPLGQFLIRSGEAASLLIWLSYTVVGYLQWFILFPKLTRKFRSSQSKNRGT